MNGKKENMNSKYDKQKIKSNKDTKNSDNTDSTNILNNEDCFSSVSNEESNNRTFISPSTNNSNGNIYLKNKNLRQNGAYMVSQRLKKDYLSIQAIDLSDNYLEDEGIMYLSMSLRLCTFLKSLDLSNNSLTEYGIRILFENLNYGYLKYLNLSLNSIDNRGAEHIGRYLPNIQIEHLVLNSTGIEEEGSKAIGFALTSNNSLKILELNSNNIKQSGSVLLSRGLVANYFLQEIYLSNNNFSLEGTLALSDCLKYNKCLRIIDLSSNRLIYESAKAIAQALKINSSLLSLNLSYNNITSAGVYELLSCINTDNSRLEYLGLKGIPVQKHLILIIELVQQRRKFQCEYGSLIMYPDTAFGRTNNDDESMIKLARYLTEKRMKLIDLFRVLDKQNKYEMDKTEFIRRMKLFEPRLTQRDITNIAQNLSKKDTIYYSTLFTQITKPKLENTFDINRKKAILNAEEERYLSKINKNSDIRQMTNKSSDSRTKDTMIDEWLDNNQNGSDVIFISDSDLKKNQHRTIKLPSITDKSITNSSKSEPTLKNKEKYESMKKNKNSTMFNGKTSILSMNLNSKNKSKSDRDLESKSGLSKKNDENYIKNDKQVLVKGNNKISNVNENRIERKSINFSSIETGLL